MVLDQTCLQGMSRGDVANNMNISTERVRTIQNQALEQLRQNLPQHLGGNVDDLQGGCG
jgi:DNA-directed RNA polymerase specialized sigma24 family protein